MQKFREYIYVDNSKIDSYSNQIKELCKTKVNETHERSAEIDGGIGIGVAKTNSKLGERNNENYILNKSTLESFFEWTNDTNNILVYNGKDINNNNLNNLIIFNGNLSIPEMGENIEILNTLSKNYQLFNTIQISEDDKEKLSYIKESENIPILVDDSSNYIFSCNLKKASIIPNINDFYDNVNEKITIIGRIDNIYNSDEDVEIFDLTKEILKLNRAIRRKLPQETLKTSIITEKGPLIKVTPLIIYK